MCVCVCVCVCVLAVQTPEQMEAMKQQVSQMSPEAIQNAMNMMNNADPEEVKRQMSSTQMPSNVEGMKQSMNAFEQHTKDQVRFSPCRLLARLSTLTRSHFFLRSAAASVQVQRRCGSENAGKLVLFVRTVRRGAGEVRAGEEEPERAVHPGR